MNCLKYKIGCSMAVFLGLPTISWAQTSDISDLPGELVNAFDEARVIASDSSTETSSTSFVYGPVDKIKQDVFYEGEVRVRGQNSSALIELPAGSDRQEVADWFTSRVESLDHSSLFSCNGADCGRATTWASDVFKIRELSAPNRNQIYKAIAIPDGSGQVLVSLYVVERGNRRVVAYLRQTRVESPVQFEKNIADRLTSSGVVRLNVTPRVNGTIPEEALERLAEIASSFDVVAASQVYVVCHLHGPGDPDMFLEFSKACAERVAEVLAENSALSPTPIGVGPLIPFNERGETRVELVVPEMIKRD